MGRFASSQQDEPAAANLAGGKPGQILRRYLAATRPQFLTASTLAVVVGTAWGWRIAGSLDLVAFLLALLSVVLVHAAANVLNDVFDELNGSDGLNVDRIYPYTGGSRLIQNQVMSLAAMRNWGIGLSLGALVPGLVLAMHAGPAILYFGAAGLALAILYSAPPVHLAGRGLGELAVAAGFGLLPVNGAAWLQSDCIDSGGLLLSIAVACWVTAILLINEVPDLKADRRAGKRTLAVRLRERGVAKLYRGLHALALIALLGGIGAGWLPLWSAPIPAVLSIAAIRAVDRALCSARATPADLRPAILTALATHTLGCAWLTGVIWI